MWKAGKTSRRERDDLGVSYVHREIKETKGRRSANQKIRSIYVCMVSSSPSKQTAGMNKEQNRTIRKKYCNTYRRRRKSEKTVDCIENV